MGLLSGRRPGDLGVRDGRLKPAPDSPNAVSSQATTAYHAIDPLTYSGSREDALEALADVVKALPRTTIVTRREDYLYAEFASALLGFVDDVEFYLPPDQKIVHVRSASRLGHSDLGVNRTRVEEIRRRFKAKGA
jgi:uncharacterized protein (DUF1499 family)